MGLRSLSPNRSDTLILSSLLYFVFLSFADFLLRHAWMIIGVHAPSIPSHGTLKIPGVLLSSLAMLEKYGLASPCWAQGLRHG